MKYKRQFFVILGHFFALLPHYWPQKEKFGITVKKTPGDIILLHMCTINEDHIMYASWDIRHNKQSFLSLWAIFCPLTLLATGKIRVLKKRKTPEDIIILHTCTINENHMMYGCWDMEHNRQNFFSFWTIFCHFTLLKTQKIKILKKWKKCQDISSFHTSVP